MLACGFAVGADGVWANCGRDNEGLRVVDDEWFERAGWALDDSFTAFYEIDDVHSAMGVVWYGAGKPVAAGFDELKFVQASALFTPTITGAELLDVVDEMFFGVDEVAIPSDVFESAFNIDRSRQAIESEASPVPHFKGEDVWGG